MVQDAGVFSNTAFRGIYLDLCTGSANVVVDCVRSAVTANATFGHSFIVGYTFTSRDPSGFNLVEREEMVARQTRRIAAAVGFDATRLDDDVIGDEAADGVGVGDVIFTHGGVVTRFWTLSLKR